VVIWHQWIGVAGTVLLLSAYGLLQSKRLSADALLYSLMNAVGALLLIVSLLHRFNLPALIIEVFWLLISGVGVIRACKRSNRGRRLP
jgi:paired small multidrug resistance pump